MINKERELKKSVWKNIFRLILPYKRRFIAVVIIGLLSTGVNLLEPLIYREAINDVAGLFVQQAKDDTRKELGVDTENDPFNNIVDKGIAAVKEGTESIKESSEKKTPSKTKARVKKPHTTTHVAGRTPQEALETLLWAVALLFLINLIGYIFWLIADNLNVKLSCYIEQRFIQSTFAHVLQLPLAFFGKRSSAAIAKQIDQSEEVTAIVNAFSQQILPEVISLVGILVIMFLQNAVLTLIAFAIIPIYLVIAWRSANKLESGLAKYYDRWEDVSARIQDALTGVKTVKLSGAENREVESLQRVSDGAYSDFVIRARLANKYVFWEAILTHIASALVLGYGGYLALQHKLTPGDVVMFVAYLDRLYNPIDSLASLWVGLQQNVASIARAFRLLDVKAEEKQGADLKVKNGRIEFKSVHFEYSPAREILKGLSFTIEPGKITALVGASGAGKTTTVDLLMRLYEPTSGEILIDGQNITNHNAASVRGQIGTVATDGAVFRGTLAYNISYKRPDASNDDIMKAAVAAGMENTLQRLPDGLQTAVGESGMGLSVGERQRIQIARVLIAQPRILVLDEATANLDYATEAEIKKTIEEIRKEHTVIIIAHRYSMVHDADHVIVLSAGEVIEEGSPQQLIAKDGWFADFARAADEETESEEEEDDKEVEEDESEE
jgi:ATP-binding cassette subfamily B protein